MVVRPVLSGPRQTAEVAHQPGDPVASDLDAPLTEITPELSGAMDRVVPLVDAADLEPEPFISALTGRRRPRASGVVGGWGDRQGPQIGSTPQRRKGAVVTAGIVLTRF